MGDLGALRGPLPSANRENGANIQSATSAAKSAFHKRITALHTFRSSATHHAQHRDRRREQRLAGPPGGKWDGAGVAITHNAGLHSPSASKQKT